MSLMLQAQIESSLAAGDDQPFRRIDLEGADVSHAALRSPDHGFWLGISTGGAIEDQHRAAAVDKQNIVDRIHSHRGDPRSCVSGPLRTRLGATSPFAVRSKTNIRLG